MAFMRIPFFDRGSLAFEVARYLAVLLAIYVALSVLAVGAEKIGGMIAAFFLAPG